MSRYFMELPSADKKTCEIAINWIKKNYPYITKGFIDAYTWVDFRDYAFKNVVWYEPDKDVDGSFLYWGHTPDTYDSIISFPGYDDIDIGEL